MTLAAVTVDTGVLVWLALNALFLAAAIGLYKLEQHIQRARLRRRKPLGQVIQIGRARTARDRRRRSAR